MRHTRQPVTWPDARARPRRRQTLADAAVGVALPPWDGTFPTRKVPSWEFSWQWIPGFSERFILQQLE